MKFILKTLLFTLILSSSYAQSDIDCKLTQLYVSQKTGEFGKHIASLDSIMQVSPSPQIRFKRMLVRHVYLAHLLYYDRKSDKIAENLAAYDKDITALEQNARYKKKMLAFRAAYYAYAAVESPTKSVYYLPKSFKLAKQATTELPNSPYSWAENGNLEYCYAAFLGGDFKNAITSFSKAVSLFEQYNMANNCNWYYLNSLLFLAKSYEDDKQLAEANKVYDKILKLRPDYTAIYRWKHKI